jgi:hypothetical protein
MATTSEEKIHIVPSFDGGMQRKTTSFIRLQTELLLAKNVDLQYVLGGIAKALGYDNLGNAINSSNAVLGCGHLNTSAGTEKLVAFSGTDAYVYNAATGNWDAQSRTFTASQKFECANFLDQMFVVNGYTDVPQNYTGAAWSTATNVTDMPKSPYIILVNSRLYLFGINIAVGGTFKSRAWYCDLPKNNALTWGFESGTDLAQTANSAVITSAGSVFKSRNIKVGDKIFITTGTNAGEYVIKSVDSETQLTLTTELVNTQSGNSFWCGGNWFDVERDNSDIAMGLGKNGSKVLFFKRFSLNAFIKTDDASTDSLNGVRGAPGTTSHRSITNIKGWTFYYADSGIWRYDGGEAIYMSSAIQEVIDGVAAASLTSIVGWQEDNRLLKMYVGDVDNTETGLNIPKCVIVYDTLANTYWVESYAHTINAATEWLNSSSLRNYLFTSDGKCEQTKNGNSFDGTTIDMEVETPFYFPIAPEVAVNMTRWKMYMKQGRDLSLLYKLAYFHDQNGLTIDEDWRNPEVVYANSDVQEVKPQWTDNKASGYALKIIDNSAGVRPVIERIAGYYTGGDVL